MIKYLVILLLLISAQAQAATVTIGTVSFGHSTGAVSSLTISHTNSSSGSARALIAGCMDDDQGGFFWDITATWNGTSMTRIVISNGSSTYRVAWFKILNPDSGTHDFVCSSNSAFQTQIGAFVADVTNFGGTFDGNVALGSSTSPSVTSNGDTHNLVIDFVGSRTTNQTFTQGSGQTKLYADDSISGTDLKTAASIETAGSSVVMDWTLGTSGNWLVTSLVLVPIGVIPSGAPSTIGPVLSVSQLAASTAIGKIYHEIRPQDNLVILLLTGWDQTFDSVTCGSDTYTEKLESNASAVWYKENPTVGICEFTITQNSSRSASITAISLRSDGQRNAATALNVSLDVTSVSGDLVFDVVSAGAGETYTVGAGQTVIMANQNISTPTNYCSPGCWSAAVSVETATGTTTTMSWTGTAGPRHAGISTKPSTVPFSTFNVQRLIKDEVH